MFICYSPDMNFWVKAVTAKVLINIFCLFFYLSFPSWDTSIAGKISDPYLSQ